jgi:hypothetical protein
MAKTLLVLVATAAMLAFAQPSLARNDSPDGTNTHAHQGGDKADPQPDHGKDNNNAGAPSGGPCIIC